MKPDFKVGDWIVAHSMHSERIYRCEKLRHHKKICIAIDFWTQKRVQLRSRDCKKASDEMVAEAVAMRLQGKTPFADTLNALFKQIYSNTPFDLPVRVFDADWTEDSDAT